VGWGVGRIQDRRQDFCLAIAESSENSNGVRPRAAACRNQAPGRRSGRAVEWNERISAKGGSLPRLGVRVQELEGLGFRIRLRSP
jgi:hypothetical protein